MLLTDLQTEGQTCSLSQKWRKKRKQCSMIICLSKNKNLGRRETIDKTNELRG